MAFLAALPEVAEVAGAGAEAGGAAGAAGEAGGASGGGGMLSRAMGLFGGKGKPQPGDANKQQNVGESRTDSFMNAANSARGALRGGVD